MYVSQPTFGGIANLDLPTLDAMTSLQPKKPEQLKKYLPEREVYKHSQMKPRHSDDVVWLIGTVVSGFEPGLRN